MYANLIMLMTKKGITIEAMSDLLSVHRNTISNKLQGASEFTYAQAELIHDTYFPEYSSRYVFQQEREDEKEIAGD